LYNRVIGIVSLKSGVSGKKHQIFFVFCFIVLLSCKAALLAVAAMQQQVIKIRPVQAQTLHRCCVSSH
jgi:hypothetical protein